MPPNNFRCTSSNWAIKKSLKNLKARTWNCEGCLNKLWKRVLINNGKNLSAGKNLNGTKSVCIYTASLVEEKSSLQSLTWYNQRQDCISQASPNPSEVQRKARCFGITGTDVTIPKKFHSHSGVHNPNITSPCCIHIRSPLKTQQKESFYVSTFHVGSQSGWRTTLLQFTHAGIRDGRPIPFLTAFSKGLHFIQFPCYVWPNCQWHAVHVSPKKNNAESYPNYLIKSNRFLCFRDFSFCRQGICP